MFIVSDQRAESALRACHQKPLLCTEPNSLTQCPSHPSLGWLSSASEMAQSSSHHQCRNTCLSLYLVLYLWCVVAACNCRRTCGVVCQTVLVGVPDMGWQSALAVVLLACGGSLHCKVCCCTCGWCGSSLNLLWFMWRVVAVCTSCRTCGVEWQPVFADVPVACGGSLHLLSYMSRERRYGMQNGCA